MAAGEAVGVGIGVAVGVGVAVDVGVAVYGSFRRVTGRTARGG